MNSPLITVIVPVYNVERYLPRCIESILRQTYTNFELILVDDGTPDRSGIICDRYAEKDSRIKVIHKENGGVSTARNVGIDVANGEWITFVDSDDWVTDDCLETLLHPLQQDDYDLVVGSLEIRRFHVEHRESQPVIINKDNINDCDVLGRFDQVEFLAPWLKLYSVRIIRDASLRFPEGVAMAEDAIFVMRYLKYCNNIFVSEKVIYHYNCMNGLSVSKRLPYYDDRVQWDLDYIEAYDAMLHSYSIEESFRKRLMSRKAILGLRTVANAIIHNFGEKEAKCKISHLFEHYDKWVSHDIFWADLDENKKHYELAMAIAKKDTNLVYKILGKRKRKDIRFLVKQIIKKMLIPFIEKHRDGLIKFKF